MSNDRCKISHSHFGSGALVIPRHASRELGIQSQGPEPDRPTDPKPGSIPPMAALPGCSSLRAKQSNPGSQATSAKADQPQWHSHGLPRRLSPPRNDVGLVIASPAKQSRQSAYGRQTQLTPVAHPVLPFDTAHGRPRRLPPPCNDGGLVIRSGAMQSRSQGRVPRPIPPTTVIASKAKQSSARPWARRPTRPRG